MALGTSPFHTGFHWVHTCLAATSTIGAIGGLPHMALGSSGPKNKSNVAGERGKTGEFSRKGKARMKARIFLRGGEKSSWQQKVKLQIWGDLGNPRDGDKGLMLSRLKYELLLYLKYELLLFLRTKQDFGRLP